MKPLNAISIVLLVAAALMVGCSSSPDKKKQEDVGVEQQAEEPRLSAQELFIQGNNALDAKDFEEAIDLYDQALQRDEARWDIHMNKAIAHSAKQQFTEAIESIDQALANGGDEQAQVYYNLGNIYQNRGLYAQSVKAYRTALAVSDRPHRESLVNLAGALTLMRQYDQAADAYEHLRSISPDDPRVYVGLGLVAQSQNNNKEALEYYEQAHAIDPEHPQAWYNKATLLERMKRYEDAVEAFNRYLSVDPDGPYTERATNRMNRLRAKQ